MINIYEQVVSLENLDIAFEKASKGKSGKRYVVDFEKNLKENLNKLQNELFSLSYKL